MRRAGIASSLRGKGFSRGPPRKHERGGHRHTMLRVLSLALGAGALLSADAFMTAPSALRPNLRAAARPMSASSGGFPCPASFLSHLSLCDRR